jgi:hypothetical protein
MVFEARHGAEVYLRRSLSASAGLAAVSQSVEACRRWLAYARRIAERLMAM